MIRMRVGLFACLVSAASILTAGPAAADPATDFLTMLRESGYDPGSTSYEEEMTLIQASAACSFLHYDYTPEVARDYLRNQYPEVSPDKLAVLVSVASKTLCGPQFAPAEPDW